MFHDAELTCDVCPDQDFDYCFGCPWHPSVFYTLYSLSSSQLRRCAVDAVSPAASPLVPGCVSPVSPVSLEKDGISSWKES